MQNYALLCIPPDYEIISLVSVINFAESMVGNGIPIIMFVNSFFSLFCTAITF